jgi:hypothetical protein
MYVTLAALGRVVRTYLYTESASSTRIGLSGRDQDCPNGAAIPVAVVVEQLEECVVVGVVRKAEEDVVGLDETWHRLE